jgi:hypothetical protein
VPRAEVREATDTYDRLDYAWEAHQPVIASLTQCVIYYSQTPDASTLSATNIAGEIEIIKLAIARGGLRQQATGVGPAAEFRAGSLMVADAALLGYAGLLSMGQRAPRTQAAVAARYQSRAGFCRAVSRIRRLRTVLRQSRNDLRQPSLPTALPMLRELHQLTIWFIDNIIMPRFVAD